MRAGLPPRRRKNPTNWPCSDGLDGESRTRNRYQPIDYQRVGQEETVANAVLESNYSPSRAERAEQLTVANAVLESNYSYTTDIYRSINTVANAVLESNYSLGNARRVWIMTVANAVLESNYSPRLFPSQSPVTVANAVLESNYSVIVNTNGAATTVANAVLESNYSAAALADEFHVTVANAVLESNYRTESLNRRSRVSEQPHRRVHALELQACVNTTPDQSNSALRLLQEQSDGAPRLTRWNRYFAEDEGEREDPKAYWSSSQDDPRNHRRLDRHPRQPPR